MSDGVHRANYLGVPAAYNLDLACSSLNEAFCEGEERAGVYLVGSCLKRRDFRDVDVRLIMEDAYFDRLFPLGATAHNSPFRSARLLAMNVAFSEWLSKMTGLPVDFQFQRATEANTEYPSSSEHPRSALGMYFREQGYVKP